MSTLGMEAQEVEDAIRALRNPADRTEALNTLAAIDARLKELTVPYEEWDVLYRQRLQVERDLLRVGLVEPGDEPSVIGRIIDRVRGI